MADFLRIKLKTLDNKVTEISVPREVYIMSSRFLFWKLRR